MTVTVLRVLSVFLGKEIMNMMGHTLSRLRNYMCANGQTQATQSCHRASGVQHHFFRFAVVLLCVHWSTYQCEPERDPNQQNHIHQQEEVYMMYVFVLL